MTIGIAVAGTGAGFTVLDTLARLECMTDGAIGGFVSLATMGSDGCVRRADVQRGGARSLLRSALDPAILAAERAVVMSSGPDRPAPLSQFTPARHGVGLATGHRFPNSLGADGRPLAEAALDLVADGVEPDRACAEVMARNPRADAGLIVLDVAGRIGMANSALVSTYGDAGQARNIGKGHAVAVLHNAIEPSGPLAALVAEMAMARLRPKSEAVGAVELRAGVPIVTSEAASAVIINADRTVTLRLATAYHGDRLWSAGLGPAAPVIEDGRTIGHALEDPFLLIKDGKVLSANGKTSIALPFVAR